MSSEDLLFRVMYLIPMLLSLTVHEFAHAWSAWHLGDDTASRLGRLTLNPIAHIDPIGTLLLPLLGVPFGWAKPVPVNPTRFTRRFTMSTGMMITAAAGPISNAILAVLSTVTYGLLYRFAPQLILGNDGVVQLLGAMIQINIALALFNLLPVPPLDGSRIVDGLLPYRLRPTWESFTRLSPFLLMGVLLFGGFVLDGPRRLANEALSTLLRVIVS